MHTLCGMCVMGKGKREERRGGEEEGRRGGGEEEGRRGGGEEEGRRGEKRREAKRVTYQQVCGDENSRGARPELSHNKITIFLIHVTMLR